MYLHCTPQYFFPWGQWGVLSTLGSIDVSLPGCLWGGGGEGQGGSPRADGDLCEPVQQDRGGEAHKRHHRPVQELQLAHQDVRGLGAWRDLLHEVKVYLQESSVNRDDSEILFQVSPEIKSH